MANKFRVNTLVLDRQNVTATGQNLYVNDILVGSGIYQPSGDYATNSALENTGSANWNHGQNNAINLSGTIYGTGSNLYSVITNFSGQADTNFATKVDLYQSGSNLYALVTSLSGQADANYATKTNLQNTGSQLYTLLTNASGQYNLNYATKSQLTSTGQTLFARDASISGALNTQIVATGSQLATNLSSTGSTLNSKINSLSGVAVLTFGDQVINGRKDFLDDTYINNLFVTGTQTVVNTQEVNVASNWVTLNATGGARDAGIFISTGITGVNATGAVIGYDVPANKWVFGLAGENDDLNGLPLIASLEDIINASGSIQNQINNLASSGDLYQTGVILIGKIDSLSGYSNATFATITNLFNTGATLFNRDTAISGGLETRINLAKSDAITHANSVGVNLSGNLFTTGANLYGLINGLSGDATGKYATKTALESTGSVNWNHARNNAVNLSGNLSETGATLFARDSSISGALNTRLGATGSTLNTKINVLSGYATNTYATITNLSNTGAVLWARDASISGDLQSQINGLSGVTGLYATKIDLESTGSANWDHGQNNAINLSGNLFSTGSVLNSKINSASGFSEATYATISNLGSTGSSNWNHLNNNGVNLSGKIFQTGIDLYNLIVTASGQANTDFATKTQLFQTGSDLYILVTNLSGQADANFATKINLSSTGSLLDSKINDLSGYADSTFSTLLNLSATGSDLYNLIVGLSGLSTGIFATKLDLESTGSANWNHSQNNAVNLSGRVSETGSTLFTRDSVISGALSTRLGSTGSTLFSRDSSISGALSTRLGTTGSNLNTKINSLSGYSDNLFATKSNLESTGSTLIGLIAGLSGQAATDYATKAQVTTTGQTLFARDTSISGDLQNQINNLSGVTGLYATKSSLESTGSSNWNHGQNNAVNLSGNLASTGSTLDGKINSLSGYAAPAGVDYLYTTGDQSITGTKTFNGAIELATGNYIRFGESGIRLESIDRDRISFVGDNGTLFSITDSLTGLLMSVADIAGLPIFEVYDSDKIVGGRFESNAFVISGSGVSLGTDYIYSDRALFISGDTRYEGQIFSGNTNIADIFASKIALESTGSSLYGIISNFSGQADINFATKSQLTTTGQTLFDRDASISGDLQNQIDGISGVTGSYATKASLESTGSANWNHAKNNAVNLSGNLNNTGSTLFARDASISGDLQGQIDSISGVTGSYATKAALESTGSANWNHLNDNAVNLSGTLASTGSSLYNIISNLSGQADVNYATKSQLTTTGQTLFSRDVSISGALSSRLNSTGSILNSKVNSLSGYGENTYSTQVNLSATGNALWSRDASISGDLQNQIDGISGVTGTYATKANLEATGSTLFSRDNSISGGLETRINLSGSTVSTNLASTGSNLYNLISSLSGQADINYATKTQLSSTGQALWNRDTSISGDLQNQINGLSGATGLYATRSNLEATGSTLWARDVSISGVLNTTISLSGAALSTRIDNTGSLLNGRIDSLSGYSNNTFATKANLESTGSSLFARDTSISGALENRLSVSGNQISTNLASTGAALFARDTAISGGLEARIATSGSTLSANLASTGSTLDDKINSLSGYAAPGDANYVYQTGNQYISGDKGFSKITLESSGNNVNPVIIFSGVSGSSNIRLETLADGSIAFIGSAGGLFGVQDSLTGSLMSVNDIAGLPIFEVFDTDKVVAGGYGTNAFVVSGSGVAFGTDYIYADKVVFISGNTRYEGHIFSGDTNITDIFATKLELASTGSTLFDRDTSISGDLQSQIDGISGVTGSYATKAALESTGSSLFARDTSISGALENRLQVSGSTISTSLQSTGSTLFSRDSSISGALEVRIATSGSTISTSLQSTGSNLYNRDASISGDIQNQIDGLTSVTGGYATKTALASTGSTLDLKINSLSGVSVLLYGDQVIEGRKDFLDNIYINNLFVTGTQTTVNTQEVNVASNWVTLNATGGARDAGIFISTGITGVNATGAVIGYDVPANKWVFGIAGENDDLNGLALIASTADIASASGSLKQDFQTADFNTGSTLVAKIDIVSGALISSGSLLNTKINSLSGYSDTTFATKTQLTSTGSTLFARDTAISGAIEGRMAVSGTAITNNLRTTGSTLFDRDTSISGALETRLALSGSTISSNLASTGSNLFNRDASISGDLQAQINSISGATGSYATKTNLEATGSTLFARDSSISGALENRLSVSGSVISSNLQSTGSTLNGKINSLSGYSAPGNANYVYRTGDQFVSGRKTFSDILVAPSNSNISPSIEFSGSSGSSNIRLEVSPNSDLSFLGAAGELFGITNSLTGTLFKVSDLTSLPIFEIDDTDKVVMGSYGSNAFVVSGSGAALGTDYVYSNRALFISGDTRYEGQIFSGDTNISDIFANKVELASTGSTLYNRDTSISGDLQAQIDGISGVTGSYATKTDLESTGSTLFSRDNSISGGLELRIFNSGSTLSANLATTGSTLFNRDSSISGGLETRISLSGSTISTSLQSTGSNLFNRDASISGDLQNQINSISGATGSYATKVDLASTGSTLDSKINSLSGYAAPSLAGYVYITGDQSIAGEKNFTERLGVGITPVVPLQVNQGTGTIGGSNPYNAALMVGTPSNGICFDNNEILKNGGIMILGTMDDSDLTFRRHGVTMVSLLDGQVNVESSLHISGNYIGDLYYPRGSNPSGYLTGFDSGVYATLVDLEGTGSNLYSLITDFSGQANVDYAPAEASYVYTTGDQIINGEKIFSTGVSISGNVSLETGKRIELGRSGIKLEIVNDDQISFVGDNGVLFSIVDSLTGILMSVTNLAGLPILEVFDSDKIVMGEYAKNAFVVSGSGAAFGTDYIYGDKVLFVSGDTRYEGNIFSGDTNITDLFYPRLSNPSGYVTGGELLASGALLTSLIESTGSANWNHAKNNGVNLSGNLSATGSTLFARDSSISGAISTRLSSTGSTLFARDSSISGAISTRLSSTGSTLNTKINSLSGYAAPGSANYVYTNGTQTIAGLKYFDDAVFWNDIGIGTGSPSQRLHIVGSEGGGLGIRSRLENTSTASYSFAIYEMKTAGSSDGLFFGGKVALDDWGIVNGITFRAGTSGQDIGFSVGGAPSGTANGPSLIVKGSTDRVGIYNTSPQEKLHVSGFIRAEDGFKSGSTNIADIFATKTEVASTGSLLDGRINSLSGYTAPGAAQYVYRTGSQSISGQKTFSDIIYADAYLSFNATATNNGIAYEDSSGDLRTVLQTWSNEDVVALANRAVSGKVQIRANTATAGMGGERIVAQFENDKIFLMTGGLGNVGIGTNSPDVALHIGPDALAANYDASKTILAVSDTTNGGEIIIRGQSPDLFFDVTSNGTGTIFLDNAPFNIDAGRPYTPGESRLFVDSNGDVGMGTNSPSEKLHVNGFIRAESGFKSGATNIADIFATKTELESTGSANWNHLNNTGSLLDNKINTLSGYSNNTFATIINLASSGSTLNSKINSLSGYSAPGSAQYVYETGAQTITGLKYFNSGIFWNNLGIGTASPNYKLHVEAKSNGDGIKIQRSSITEGDYAELAFDPTTNDAGTPILWIRGIRGASYAANYMTLGTNDTERMRITEDGKVGINNDNPQFDLEVSGSFAATTKSFIIPHPTKSGKRLQHGVLEGPSHSVYVKGRSKNGIIELPEYWSKLIDPDTMNIQITPIGKHQKLYVEDFDMKKVTIGNSSWGKLNFFYYIVADRVDIDKLKIEL